MRIIRFFKHTILFLVVAVGLISLAVKFITPLYLEKYLEENFAVNASIGTIQFNVLNGKVGMEGVHIYGDNKQSFHLGRLLLDIDLGLLLEGKLFAEKVLLSNMRMDLRQEMGQEATKDDNSWIIGGMKIPSAGDSSVDSNAAEKSDMAESSSWPIGVGEIRVDNVGVALDLNDIKSEFVIESFRLDGATQWTSDHPSTFDFLLRVNGSGLRLAGNVKPFSPVLDLDVTLDVDALSLAPLISKIENDLSYNDLQATLNAAMQISYSLIQESHHVDLKGELVLSNISFTDVANHLYVAEDNIQWNGDASIVVPGSDEAQDIKIASLSTLVFSPLRIETTDSGILLGQFSRLVLSQIKVDSMASVKIGRISLTQFSGLKNLADSTKELILIDGAVLSGLAYDNNKVLIEKVDLSAVQANIVLNGKGLLPLSTKVKNTQQEKQKDVNAEDNVEMVRAKEPVNDGDPLPIVIRQFSIDGESYIKFSDYSVSPFFETEISKIDLKAKNIDTGNNAAWMDIQLRASIDDYGQINLRGKAQPFSKLVNAKAELDIDNVSLVPFSSYSGKYADLFIKRGVLSSKIKINIVEDRLDINNAISLNKLTLEPGKSEVSKRWLSNLPMPLDLTLDVLRDKNDVIALDIPIEGLISDPDFHLDDIYNTAMAKALKFAATYYITQAVQPLGLVITAGKLIGKAAQPRFEPLIFEAGSADLSAANKKHLKKIAKLFADRPKLSLTVCGVSAEMDWIAMQDKQAKAENKPAKKDLLLKLASLRGDNVKRYIINASNLDSARILACNAKVDENVEAMPIVELSL